MPAHDTFPADADVQTFFGTNAAIAVPAGFSFAGYGDMAKIRFERRTKRLPFLEDASDVTRRFDPPGGQSQGPAAGSFTGTFGAFGGGPYLELNAGILSVTQVLKWITPSTPGGTPMVEGTDYLMMPLNAPAEGKPWEGIQIMIPVYGSRGSIKVTGKWGYAAKVPEDVWQACLRIGAVQAANDILQKILSSPNRIKSASGAEIEQTVRTLGDGWNSYVDKVVSDYMLRVVGI